MSFQSNFKSVILFQDFMCAMELSKHCFECWFRFGLGIKTRSCKAERACIHLLVSLAIKFKMIRSFRYFGKWRNEFLTVIPNFSRVRCRISGVMGKMKLPKQYKSGLSPRDFAIFQDKIHGQHHPRQTEEEKMYHNLNSYWIYSQVLGSWQTSRAPTSHSPLIMWLKSKSTLRSSLVGCSSMGFDIVQG